MKVMCSGVVANPNEERGFDGRVYLSRVSKQKTVNRASRNSRFSVDVLVNQALGDGAWKDIVREEENDCQSVGELKEKVIEMCDLDEFVALCCSCDVDLDEFVELALFHVPIVPYLL